MPSTNMFIKLDTNLSSIIIVFTFMLLRYLLLLPHPIIMYVEEARQNTNYKSKGSSR